MKHARAKTISVIAIFTSLIIASDLALAPIANVKLMDTLVFSASFAYGLRMGASIAVLSELIWSIITPYGFFLPIVPYLVGGELIFAFAGYFASKFWQLNDVSDLAPENVFFGAILALCAFVWDFETNIATGLIANVHSIIALLAFEFNPLTMVFNVLHEASDFVFGSTVVPIIIVFFRKNAGRLKPSSFVSEKALGSTILEGGE